MRNWTQIILFFILMQASLKSNAQDPYYSQYFNAPLTLNPAFTGYYDGIHRLTTNFRNQWLSAGTPFTTTSVSFDTRLLQGRLDKSMLGVGVVLMNDRTSSGAYSSNYASLSAAYHQSLDDEGNQHLAIGFQGSMGSRMLDYNRISFTSQFSSRGFDLSLSNTEDFITQRAVYNDINVGAMYNYLKDRKRVFIGASLYHINQPRMTFLGNDEYVLPSRFTVHGGSSFLVGVKGELFLSALYVKQGAATTSVVGAAYGVSLQEMNDDNVFYLGLFYRNQDAIYPYIGYLFNDLQIGLSYDLNTSGIQVNNRRNRSFELSVKYHFFDPNVARKAMPWN
jgi:type IX secretion system PorP/SprF family membrane protein